MLSDNQSLKVLGLYITRILTAKQ